MTAQDVKSKLLKKREKTVLSRESAVSTGSTLLNLAATDTVYGAITKGSYAYFVGDTQSGKTWFSHSIFAEATINPAFKDYVFIYDNVEGGVLFDVAQFFGKACAARIQPASQRKGQPNSITVEDFYDNITDWIASGKKFIYVLDSQDALDSLSATKKFNENKKARQSNKEGKGSYGDGKAKYHSEHIRGVISGLRKTGSILVIIGQTRDNIDIMSFEKKTRAGGRSLSFYASMEMWFSVHKKITKDVRGKKRTIGGHIMVYVKKNRATGKTGKDRGVLIPIYYSLGVDDVGSCVNYLIEENHWKPAKVEGKKVIRCPEFPGTEGMSRSEIIRHIEDENLEEKLREIVGTVWAQIEEESKINRKQRYA